jgi:endo-1,4-beta-mannosidase
MNEPRSQAELYVVKRQTTDGSKEYNISYNPANDLQDWIENMAGYVKSMDPIHLLSTGASPIHPLAPEQAWLVTVCDATA